MAKKTSKKSSLMNAIDKPYVPSPEEKKRQRQYEVEDAMHTVQRADEIKKDKALMKEVKSMAKEKINELKKIC